MASTRPQLFVHLRRPGTALRRALPVALVAVGLVLVGHALYLGLSRPGFLGGVPLGQVLPGFQLLFGAAVAAAGLLGRQETPPALSSTLFALAVIVLTTGPGTAVSLGLVQWTVLSAVAVVCVALPALALVAVDRFGLFAESDPRGLTLTLGDGPRGL